MSVVCVCVVFGGVWGHLSEPLGGAVWQTVGATDDVCRVSFGAAVAVHVHRWPGAAAAALRG